MQRKIKVVEIIADSSLGGGPSHVLNLLLFLDEKIFEPYLICPAGYLSTEVKKIAGVKIFNVPMKSKTDLISVFEIRQFVQKIQSFNDPFSPTIVHCHGTRAGLLGRIFGHRDAKIIYTEHRYDADYHLKNSLNEYWQKKILGRLNKKSDAVIAVSSSVQNYLLDRKLANKKNLFLIPNAVDTQKISPKNKVKKVKSVHRAPIIGTIGNLNLQKGQSYLISAMKLVLQKFPLASLEIVGEGEERVNLENQIKLLGLEHHMTLLGRKNNAADYLNHFDVFVLPSIAETFGIVILEAMASGVPVVASRVGGICDIVENKKTGLLVPPRQPQILAEAIVKLLDHPAEAAKYKRAGLQRVTEFDWRKVIKEIEKVYIDVASIEK